MAAEALPTTAPEPSVGDLPADIPGPNDTVRALFDVYGGAEALKVPLGEEVVYLLPWAARRGGVAGYRQPINTFRARPVEISADEAAALLEERAPQAVALANTPAALLDDRGTDDVRVSWHARVRWAERVEPSPDPGPAIRDAFADGVSVGVDRGHARYYAPEDVVVTYVHDHGRPRVTTVYEPDDVDDLGANHLTDCPHCGERYNPGNQEQCACCGGAICPWCGKTVA